MIGIVFQFGSEVVEVRINNDKVYFRDSPLKEFATIDGLKLNKSGVIKEFPDLRENTDWQKIARERFKEKMRDMKNENERFDYIVNDLKKFGYVPKYKQRQGFRPESIK